ncbi:hypothetical protein Pmani_003697 [Petrolisthes manimaculis]|uniref:Uncharacterized protein n=1 Tax=Petrolisthes manimaculis TaxID=1843537 RepID=A0AAE1QFU0_9EUCA|nr:hypothetical protein Pmani_003697 [Petrolisthes manimaculis]
MLWWLIFLASTVALSPELWKQQVRRMGEVVNGPTQNASFILHLDPTLPEEVQRAVLQEIHHMPHLILTLGHNFSFWISPHNYIHIALLTKKHQMLVSYPPPRSLLLLALDSELDASLLTETGDAWPLAFKTL